MAKLMMVSLLVSAIKTRRHRNVTQAIQVMQVRGSAQKAHRHVNPTLPGALAKAMSNRKPRAVMVKMTTVTEKRMRAANVPVDAMRIKTVLWLRVEQKHPVSMVPARNRRPINVSNKPAKSHCNAIQSNPALIKTKYVV